MSDKDTIYRRDAIDAVNAYLGLSAVSRTIQNMTSIQEILENLPSAQPERKTGKWLRSGNCIFPYECDQCGDANERATSFCPNCGADMRGGGEE